MATSILIIGAGTFGASTALALKTAEPEARVILMDRTPFPCPMAAGHDLNKIVRADYTDVMYMKLALEALDIWRNDPLYNQHFRQTGMLYSYDRETCEEIVRNYEKLLGKGHALSKYMDPAEARVKFGGVFRDAKWERVEQCLWSPSAGWVDSAAALKSVIQEAVDIGVEYVEETASKLLLDEHGACVGAQTQHGLELKASRTILAAGANIHLILAESAPDRPEIHAGDLLIAVGAAMCAFKVPDDQMAKFKDCPVNEVLGQHISQSPYPFP
jgi:sarcosine oxidase / L-pipecolate oxidase